VCSLAYELATKYLTLTDFHLHDQSGLWSLYGLVVDDNITNIVLVLLYKVQVRLLFEECWRITVVHAQNVNNKKTEKNKITAWKFFLKCLLNTCNVSEDYWQLCSVE